MNKNSIILLITIFYLSAVSATILTDDSDTTFSDVAENKTVTFNFSVESIIGNETTNITKVELVLPVNFTLITGSNGTSAFGTYVVVSSKPTWSGTPIILNGSKAYFWIRATSPNNPGNYDFSVNTHNSTGVFEQGELAIEVLDTVIPNITLHSPEAKTYTEEFTLVNISMNEKGVCYYSKDRGKNNLSLNTYGGGKNFAKNVSFSEGKETINFYCRDEAGNWNNEGIVSFRLNYSDGSVAITPVTNVANVTIIQNNTNTMNGTKTSTLTNKTTLQKNNSLTNTAPKIETKQSPVTKWVVITVMVLVAVVLLVIVGIKAKNESY